MTAEQLHVDSRPAMHRPRMLLGFSGWMDGGDVSTGTIDHLGRVLEAERFAWIDAADFYLYSFPGSMEVAAMFRPYVKIEDGLVVEFDPPVSEFYACPAHNLILFRGREPNLRWDDFADCILAVAEMFDAQTIYFIGSVAGLVPHTREPRLYSSVSDPALKAIVEPLGVRFSNYEGPGSLITYLTRKAKRRDVPLATLVAEIPAYIQGINPRAIESAVRRLAAMLDVEVPLEDLREASDVFEQKLGKILSERSELGDLIAKMESDYDNEVFDTQMGDLKQWLTDRGVRPD